MDQILRRYQQVIETIDETAHAVGRSGEDVKLVVVTKSHPIEMVRVLAEGGVKDLGENRRIQRPKCCRNFKRPDCRVKRKGENRKIGRLGGRRRKLRLDDRSAAYICWSKRNYG